MTPVELRGERPQHRGGLVDLAPRQQELGPHHAEGVEHERLVRHLDENGLRAAEERLGVIPPAEVDPGLRAQMVEPGDRAREPVAAGQLRPALRVGGGLERPVATLPRQVVERERGQEMVALGQRIIDQREHRGAPGRPVAEPPGRRGRCELERAAELDAARELRRIARGSRGLEQGEPLRARPQGGARPADEELTVAEAAQDLAHGLGGSIGSEPLARSAQLVEHVDGAARPDRAGGGERRRGGVADLLEQPARLVEVLAALAPLHPQQESAPEVAREVAQPHQQVGARRQAVLRIPERERALVVCARLGVAAELDRAPGCPYGELQAPHPVARAEGVLERLVKRERAHAAGSAGDLEHARVPSPALGGEQAREHRLAGEGVAESEAGVGDGPRVRHEPRLAQSPEGLERGFFTHPGRGRQQIGVEALAEHGRPADDLAVAVIQRAHPPQEHLLHRPGQDDRLHDVPPPARRVERADRDGVADELLDDERVAAAGVVDHRRHVGAGVRAKDVA